MTRERQQKRQEETREAILAAARDIVARDGVNGLSIRKITGALDYSPAIVYHYFKDKNEILQTLLGEGYAKILSVLSTVQPDEEAPEREIRQAFTAHMRASLASPDVYRAFVLNDDPAVLQRTALLKPGAAQASRTMQGLIAAVERGMASGRFRQMDAELTAQILWTATFGLLMKLIVEKDVPSEQIDRLIAHHFRVLFGGILTKPENFEEEKI